MPAIEGYIGKCHPENSTVDRGVIRENLDKIYCRPLIDETRPKSVQKHNNGPQCMTTVNILKNFDCANSMRVWFAVDCKTTSFEHL
jgi:hypothetical protein